MSGGHSIEFARARPRWLPAAGFVALAVVGYGWILWFQLGDPLVLGLTPRDVWQHLAALQALMLNPAAPLNPFVATADPSRLFGPVHVVLGWAGHAFGWTILQAYVAVCTLNLTMLAGGIWAFARSYYRNPWGPLVLLAVTLLGWAVAFTFPGVQSPVSLIKNVGIPATFMIGAGLFGWAWTIRLLRRWSAVELALFTLFVALMFANHQLGAGIMLIGCGCFWLAGPAPWRQRAGLAAAVAAGLTLAAAWPYFDPWAVFVTAERASWRAGIDFYAAQAVVPMLVPAALGVFGLRRPTLLMAGVFFGLYSTGLAQVAVAHRFLSPLTLVLQIGLAQLILDHGRRHSLIVAGLAMACIAPHAVTAQAEIDGMQAQVLRDGNVLSVARVLLADRPAGIAAWQAAAWPVVANGMKVLITPFTETLIPDQPRRWKLNEALFARHATPAARLALACRLHVGTLVAEADTLAAPTQAALRTLAIRTTRSRNLLRYDLPACGTQ